MRGWGLLFIFFTLGCIEEIYLDLPESDVSLKVIEGYVERDNHDYIFWGKTSIAQNVTGPIDDSGLGAKISFEYNEGTLVSIPEGEITRIPIGSFHEMYGGSADDARFRMIVHLEGGKYVTPVQRIKRVPKADSLSVKVVSRSSLNHAGYIITRPYAELTAHSSLINRDGEKVSLSWEVTGTFRFREGERDDEMFEPKECYSTFYEFNNEINIAGAQDHPEGKVKIKIAETISDFRFGITCFFNAAQKSLDQDVIDFWKDVKASNERSGTFFDVFPGTIRTNVINENNPEEIISGYFYVSEVDTVRLKVVPSMVGFPLHHCANWEEPEEFIPDNTDPCWDCLNLPNSTVTKPHYWR